MFGPRWSSGAAHNWVFPAVVESPFDWLRLVPCIILCSVSDEILQGTVTSESWAGGILTTWKCWHAKNMQWRSLSEFPKKKTTKHSLSWSAGALFWSFSPWMGGIRTREVRLGKLEAIPEDALLCGPQLRGKQRKKSLLGARQVRDIIRQAMQRSPAQQAQQREGRKRIYLFTSLLSPSPLCKFAPQGINSPALQCCIIWSLQQVLRKSKLVMLFLGE